MLSMSTSNYSDSYPNTLIPRYNSFFSPKYIQLLFKIYTTNSFLKLSFKIISNLFPFLFKIQLLTLFIAY